MEDKTDMKLLRLEIEGWYVCREGSEGRGNRCAGE